MGYIHIIHLGMIGAAPQGPPRKRPALEGAALSPGSAGSAKLGDSNKVSAERSIGDSHGFYG